LVTLLSSTDAAHNTDWCFWQGERCGCLTLVLCLGILGWWLTGTGALLQPLLHQLMGTPHNRYTESG